MWEVGQKIQKMIWEFLHGFTLVQTFKKIFINLKTFRRYKKLFSDIYNQRTVFYCEKIFNSNIYDSNY